jgi:hypothetical protein
VRHDDSDVGLMLHFAAGLEPFRAPNAFGVEEVCGDGVGEARTGGARLRVTELTVTNLQQGRHCLVGLADTVWRIVGKRGCVLAVETVLGCYVLSTFIDTQQRRKDMLI